MKEARENYQAKGRERVTVLLLVGQEQRTW